MKFSTSQDIFQNGFFIILKSKAKQLSTLFLRCFVFLSQLSQFLFSFASFLVNIFVSKQISKCLFLANDNFWITKAFCSFIGTQNILRDSSTTTTITTTMMTMMLIMMMMTMIIIIIPNRKHRISLVLAFYSFYETFRRDLYKYFQALHLTHDENEMKWKPK